MLSGGEVLYHGSYSAVEQVDLSRCAPEKDFGRGFYLTSDRDQARRFIASSLRKAQALGHADAGQRHGFVSAFKVDAVEGLDVYEFAEAGPEWLRFVSLNRRSSLAGELSTAIDARLLSADVVIGKIANDTTNRVITTYLNGLYGEIDSARAEQTAIGLLLPDRLKDQYCFRTEKAIERLVPVGVEQYEI